MLALAGPPTIQVLCFRRALALAAGIALAACASSTQSGSTDPNAYVGTWDLAIESGNCGSAFDVRFTIDQDDANAASDGFINVVSDWWFPSNPSLLLNLSGSINWHRDDFDLRFHKSNVQGQFTGTGASSTRLEGVFSDPGGDFWVGLGTANCLANTVATKQYGLRGGGSALRG
ncbi:MAG: hypothetical protein ACREL3_04640 [Gemmatimonadales bacterium]